MALGYRRVWLIGLGKETKRSRIDTDEVPTEKDRTPTSYVLRWRDTSGRIRQKNCGAVPKKVAERLRSEREHDLNERGDPEEQKQDAWPFEEFISAYLEARKNEVSTEHLAGIGRTLRLFGETMRPETIQRVTPAMVRGFYRLRLEDVRKISANKDLRHLKAAFKFALEKERVSANPVATVKQQKVEPKQPRALDGDEVAALLRACPDDEWRTYVSLLVTCGLRRSEGLRLRWKDVRLEAEGPMHIRLGNTKSKRPRVLPVPKETAARIWNLNAARTPPEPDVFVFEGLSRRHRTDVSRLFSGIAKRVGVEACSLKSLRSTYATDRARAGVPPYQLRKLLGHSSITTTERYYVNVPDADLDRFSRPSYAHAVGNLVTPDVTVKSDSAKSEKEPAINPAQQRSSKVGRVAE